MSCIVGICIISGGLVALNNNGTYAVLSNNAWGSLKAGAFPASDFISISAALSSPNNIVAITPTSGAYTDNGNADIPTWTTFDFPLGLAAAGVSKTAASTIILIYPNGFVRRSPDNGTTWQSPGNIIGLGRILRVSTNDNQIFVVDDAGKVAYTADGNEEPTISWVTTTASGLPNPVGVSGKNATELSVVDANGNGRFSTNGGQTWADWELQNKPKITGIVDMAATYVVMNTKGEAERTLKADAPPTNWQPLPTLTGHPNDCSPPSNIIYVGGKNGSTNFGCGGTRANPCKFLQDALGQATPGTQIRVAEGTYNLDDTGGSLSFTIPSGVKVYGGYNDIFSESDPTTRVTTLSVGNSRGGTYVITFQDVDSTTTLDGFTITGGSDDKGFLGGCVIENSSPKIANCVFSGNGVFYLDGGAVHNFANRSKCSPSFENCVFSGNTGDIGGAVSNQANGAECSPSFENCVFSGNKSLIGNGGAVGNRANGAECSPSFENCVFSGNESASGNGGAVHNFANSAKCSPSFENCVFSGNKSVSGNGGAVYNIGNPNVECKPSFTFVTFYNNNASSGKILFSTGKLITTIKNSILWDADASASGLIINEQNSTITISYSDIVEQSLLTAGANNISKNPQFLNPDQINTNKEWFTYKSGLALKPGSPCLDKGKDQPDILVDITGNPRPEPPSMGAYDGSLPKVIRIDTPGPKHVKLDIGPNEILTSVIMIAKGADGGNLYTTATPPTLKTAGGKGATLKAIYTDTGVLDKIKKNGIVVNVGASWQTVNLAKGKFIFTSTGGGPTTAFIPTDGAVIPEPTATLVEWGSFFFEQAAKITDLLLLAGGGGGGSEKENGADAPLQIITTNNAMQKVGIGKSQLGPGAGAYPFGPGLISALLTERSQTEVTVMVLDGDASGGYPLDNTPKGEISIKESSGFVQFLASAHCFAVSAAGFYLGGLAGMDLILLNTSTKIPIRKFGGGGGAGYSGGDGATDTQAAQGGTSYINPLFPTVNSSITIASLDAEQAAYEDAEEEAIGDADAPLEHSQQIVISQDEASEIERAFRALRTTFETASVEELVEIFFNSEVLGITNEREKQGSVIISYTTAPIPTPISTVPQETEIITTNMVYDWNISTSTQKIQLDLES